MTDVWCGELHVSDVILDSFGELEGLRQQMVRPDPLIGVQGGRGHVVPWVDNSSVSHGWNVRPVASNVTPTNL